MIIDNNLVLAGSISSAGVVSGQLVTSAGNTLSTNTLDTGPLTKGGNQPVSLAEGEDLHVVVDILQTLTSGGSATVQVQYVMADDAALSTNLQVVSQTDAFAYTELTAGSQITMDVPHMGLRAAKRYQGLRFVIGTAALTNATGQFFAAIVKDPQQLINRYFNSGFSVS